MTVTYNGLVAKPTGYNTNLNFRAETGDTAAILTANERNILADVLFYDNENGTDTEFQGTYDAKTNLAVQLQYVTDADIKAYVKRYNDNNGTKADIEFAAVKSVFAEARSLSIKNTAYNATTGDIANMAKVQTALSATTPDLTLIQNYVTAYDKEDGVGLKNVTVGDLERFARFYELNEVQKANLVKAYNSIATIQVVSGDNNDKIVAKSGN